MYLEMRHIEAASSATQFVGNMRGLITISALLLLAVIETKSWDLSSRPTRYIRRCWPLRCQTPPEDCASQDHIYEIKFRYGRQCIGCEICKTDLPFCPVPCLAFIPTCAAGERLTKEMRIMDGIHCQACQKCEKKNEPVKCPRRLCPLAPTKKFCRNLQTRGDYYLPDGTTCEGCPYCDPKDVICPLVPCPNPGPCYTPAPSFDFFGKKCFTCPTPVPCQDLCLQCPLCAPPPDYVAPPPDKNGCTPCPPCGVGPFI